MRSFPIIVLPLLASCASAAPTKPEATISIRADRIIGPVNPLVFGSNIEASDAKGIFGAETRPSIMRTGSGVWDDEKMVPSGAAKLAREAGVSLWRYPGGCLAHNFSWKKAVGPLASRGDWRFGVDEFLKLCAATKSQAVFTIPDYTDTPQDAADLVEYLNSPADAKHPWAQQRARNGHPKPYGVRWFELGNESNHGNHDLQPPKTFTAQQYADYALARAKAMKAVDPSIQIGVVSAVGAPPEDPWNALVFEQCKNVADFVVVHHYPVGYGADDPNVDEARLMGATMAAGEQLERELAGFRAIIKQSSKRDLPIALTEYNAGLVQEKPKPYRYSWGAALFSADYARTLLQPKNRILMANYWHFANGYWGAVQGSGDTWTPKPAFEVYRAWTRFGTQLLDVQTNSPHQDFAGFGSTKMTSGPRLVGREPLGPPDLMPAKLSTPSGTGFSSRIENGTLIFDLKDFKGLSYPNLTPVNRPDKTGPQGARYKLSYEARWTPEVGSGAIKLGLGLGDARGWEQTKSAAAMSGAEAASNWRKIEGFFEALPDARAITVLARLEGSDVPASGRLEMRNLRLSATSNTLFPAYALLTSTASLSSDHKTVCVVVFNKSADRALSTDIRLTGFAPKQARAWTLDAPALAVTDVGANGVREHFAALSLPQNRVLRHTFPARSMTTMEFRLQVAPDPKVNTRS